MASARLRKTAVTVFCRYNSAQRQSSSLSLIGKRTFADKSSSLGNDESDPKLDVPLKYTGSKAHAWRAQQTRSGNWNHDLPWYQPYVIFVSLSTFMIYFFILREENDIDRKFDLTLYDHIEGLEERHIEEAIEYKRNKGIDTKDLEARLKELREQ